MFSYYSHLGLDHFYVSHIVVSVGVSVRMSKMDHVEQVYFGYALASRHEYRKSFSLQTEDLSSKVDLRLHTSKL